MKTRSSLKPRLANAALAGALAVLATAAVAAQPLPKEGTFAFRACWSGTRNVVAISKTHVGSSFEFTGEAVADEPGGLFDRNTFQCEGMGARLGKQRIGDVICVGVDPDGDKHMERYTLKNDGKWHRKEITGTGKYEGIVTNNKVVQLGPFPVIKPGTFQGCNHTTGTYKLK